MEHGNAVTRAAEVVNKYWTVDYDDELIADIARAINDAVAQAVEACIDVIREKGGSWHDALPDDRPTLMNGLNQIAAAIRARSTEPRQ